MLDGLKTQITLAVLGAKTLLVDFIGVSADQITETASAMISIGLVLMAGLFRYMGNVREEKLRQTLEWAEKKVKA